MKAIEYFKKITKNIKHGNGSFYDHCYGVYSFLKERSFPEYVCLAGLYHSIYGTEYFKPGLNINRNLVKKLIGNKAEKLVYLFCNIKNRDPSILKIAEKNKNLFFIAYANLVEPSNYQENASKEYLDFKHKYYLKYQSLIDSFKTSKKIKIIDDFFIQEMILFPTFAYGIDNFLNEKEKNKLLKYVLKQEKHLDHIFQTDGLDHNKKIYKCLSDKIKIACKDIFNYQKLIYDQFEITGMWTNIINENNNLQPHTHSNNFLSGVYYLQTDDNSSNIVFSDPRPNVIAPKTSERTIHNSSIWWIKPKQNTVIFFPSWLQHYVESSKSKEKRISIAFNIMFKGLIGSTEDLTQSNF